MDRGKAKRKFYSREDSLKRLIKKIKEDKKIKPSNKKLIIEYYNTARANTGIARTTKLIQSAYVFAKTNKKSVRQMKRNDMEAWIGFIKNDFRACEHEYD